MVNSELELLVQAVKHMANIYRKDWLKPLLFERTPCLHTMDRQSIIQAGVR